MLKKSTVTKRGAHMGTDELKALTSFWHNETKSAEVAKIGPHRSPMQGGNSRLHLDAPRFQVGQNLVCYANAN
jgi:hypothetical protein